MKDYHKLYKYLSYFENLKNEYSAGRKNSFVVDAQPLYTQYDQELFEFVLCVYEVGFVDYDYHDTLQEYSVTNREAMDRVIPSADEQILKAILTKMIRDERFKSGAWISYMEKGLFEKVLRRMGELYGVAS